MEVLVLGATGSLGRAVSAELGQREHGVRAASRSARSATEGQPSWVRVDLRTGAGLGPAVEGMDAVIDAANVRSVRRAALDAVLVDGTRRVLGACQAAGNVHYVGISIVGIDRVPYGYYQAKLRQERAIEDGPAPWSLLRSTQFHELIDQLCRTAARLPVMVLPTAARIQPVDVADVARRLADVAEGPAVGRLPEVGGPRVQTLGELAEEWLRDRRLSKRVVRLPLPARVGRPLAAGALCTPENAVHGRSFAQWLATSGPAGGAAA